MIRDFIPAYLKKELQIETEKIKIKNETMTIRFFREWAESLFLKGQSVKDIAYTLEIDRVTISRWLQKKGHLKKQPYNRKVQL